MRVVLCLVIGVLLAGTVYADLQNVSVGGQLEIRGRWYHNAFETGTGLRPSPTAQVRIPAALVPLRPIGQAGNNVLSLFRYSDWGNDWHFVEQTTSLNVTADLTDNVNAFIEFYDFEVWGEDFRSNYLTGIDSRATTSDDVEVLQAYIETNETFGQPLRLRIGRQVIQFGRDLNAFLLAGKTSPTQRFSYDAIRATYKPTEKLTLDAWWAKLCDRSPLEEDGDTDFYGVWANYKFGDPLDLSLFWLWIKDDSAIKDTNGSWLFEQLENVFGIDDYDGSDFHTVGFEVGGKWAGFDYLARVAYQFGDAGHLGYSFRAPWAFSNLAGILYGDDRAEYDNWGMDLTVGYTFESAWNIRPYVQGVWFEGQDNRDLSFWDWLNPFDRPKASVSFNRLFSDINYCPVVNDNADMSNYYQATLGVTMTPTEKLWMSFRAYNTWADKTFDWPAYINVPRIRAFGPPWKSGRLPIAGALSFWDEEGDSNIGFSLDGIIKYNYSANLTLFLYYGHLFPGEGAQDGAFVSAYGTMMNGGLNDKDADYVFWWAILKF